MAVRYTYTPNELLHLRESPLVEKPLGLPPAEQWMGTPQDPTRNSTKTTDRAKNHDSNNLLDNRRPQHISRNSANPEDIILGPPKTSFMSSTARRNDNKGLDTAERPPIRESDPRDRFNFRNKNGDGENDRMRDVRNNTLRPKRTEGDQDSDGWSTVKPRKSFGTEGAERFNGRMGVDRHKDERRFKDREDRDGKDRPARGFENFSREARDARDKDADHDQDRDTRKTGVGRGRNESWFRADNDAQAPAPRERNSNGDRFASRGWREKDSDQPERSTRNDRGDRRWDRDRNERKEDMPVWSMDELGDEKNQAHTQEDFMKWKEQQQIKDKGGKTPVEEMPKAEVGGGFFGLDKPKFETPLAIDTGPDKFFGMWATPKDENGPESAIESKKEGAAKGKSVGKASRFTSFFSPAQEEPPRRQTEPPLPMPAPATGGFGALFQNNVQGSGDSSEKEAFQQLLQKLQRQTVTSSGSTPPANASQQPKPPSIEQQHNQPNPPPEQFQQSRHERQERQDEGKLSASIRNSQQALQDLLSQRQIAGSQPTIRPEQMLQELVGQRQNALSQSSLRADQPQNRNNTDFLMNLMRGQPEPQRTEQIMLRMPGGKPPDRQMDRRIQEQQMMEREQEMQREAAARERGLSQRQGRPPPGLQGFYDESFQQRGPPPQHERPPQPTQILQRPPPPGLDQVSPGWAPPSQLPPQQLRQQQHIAPPPGFSGRGMPPIPPQMFQPGYPPMGNFPPPDVMAGPPRGGMPPPGMIYPTGFLPAPGFHGPDNMAFGGPYDGRGPPPNGAFRRQ